MIDGLKSGACSAVVSGELGRRTGLGKVDSSKMTWRDT